MNQTHSVTPKPDSFVACVAPVDRGGSCRWPAPSSMSRTIIDMVDTAITLDFAEECRLTASPDGQRLLLLAGDIYRPQAADAGAALLDLYARRGLDFVADLNGTFCLLLVDKAASIVAFATDRMNSYKLLVSQFEDSLVVSNSIYLQPVQGARIDRAAVAGYLTNSYIYNDRTPYERVRMLDSGSVYRLENGRLSPRRYWRFQYLTPATASPQALKHDLGDLLIEATRRRVRADRPLYVSLSGGYDSSSITAILSHKLGVKDVTCFTYAQGDVQPGSDEFVARQIAAQCGYSHQVIPAFDGDLIPMLALNARFGGGMTRPCDEVEAWARLGQQVAGSPAPVLLTGDTLMVEPDWHFHNRADLIAAARMRDFSVLAWLEPFIGADVYREFLAATRADVEIAVQRLPPHAEPNGFRDMLRFDQIQSRVTGTYREYFAARFFRPAHPLFDHDLLDFVLRLPVDLRRRKRLFLETVTAMFPALYAFPRATFASYATYWPTALRQQNAALQALVREQSSPLDDVLPPDVLLALLAADRPSLTRSNARAGNLLKHLYRLLRRANLHRLPLGRPSLYTPAVSADNLLKRALTLRAFLSHMETHASPTG